MDENTHPYFEARSETVTIASEYFGPIKTHYRVYGNGDPLLLLHGLATSSYTWRHTMTALAQHYTLYMPDIPGFGQSPPLSARPEAEGLAHWVEGFQKAVKIRRCPCVASDVGAYLAMRTLLIKRRGKPPITQLVSIHPPTFPELKLYALKAALGTTGIAELVAWFIRRNPEAWIRGLIHPRSQDRLSPETVRQYSAPLTTYGGSMAQVQTLLDTLDPVALETFFATFRLKRFTQEGFPVPLLLIYGERDPIISSQHRDRLAEYLPEDIRLITMSGASRLVQEDAPERLMAHLVEFLKPGETPVKAPKKSKKKLVNGVV